MTQVEPGAEYRDLLEGLLCSLRFPLVRVLSLGQEQSKWLSPHWFSLRCSWLSLEWFNWVTIVSLAGTYKRDSFPEQGLPVQP